MLYMFLAHFLNVVEQSHMATVRPDRFENVIGKINWLNGGKTWICNIVNKDKGRGAVDQSLDDKATDGYELDLPAAMVTMSNESEQIPN